MKNIPFDIWFGGFAEPILKRALNKESLIKCLHVDIGRKVYDLYSDHKRIYHNAYHPWWMFNFAWQHNITLTPAQELAILFHDVIYKLGDSMNEQNSADYMYDIFRENCEEFSDVCDASKIIEDTAKHFDVNPSLDFEPSNLVLDLDIMNMAVSYREFLEWNSAIEEEIKLHDSFDLDARLTFLEFFITKKDILHSSELKGYEPLIRENLYQLIYELNIQKKQLG